MMAIFAERLPGNPALPVRRQTFARIALGALGYSRESMSVREWEQSQRDADYLLAVHNHSAARTRWRICPPLPLTDKEPRL